MPKKRKPAKKGSTMGRPPKFKGTAAKNMSVYLPEETIDALRRFAAFQYQTTGLSRHASDIILDALKAHGPFRDFAGKLKK